MVYWEDLHRKSINCHRKYVYLNETKIFLLSKVNGDIIVKNFHLYHAWVAGQDLVSKFAEAQAHQNRP